MKTENQILRSFKLFDFQCNSYCIYQLYMGIISVCIVQFFLIVLKAIIFGVISSHGYNPSDLMPKFRYWWHFECWCPMRVLATKQTKIVTIILKLSSTHFVINIDVTLNIKDRILSVKWPRVFSRGLISYNWLLAVHQPSLVLQMIIFRLSSR